MQESLGSDEEDAAGNEQFHPTSLVTLGDRRANVDVELAPLVLELWRADIETDSCCQDCGEYLASGADTDPHIMRLAER